jgi:tetratricopeptide (TPR) repeat protein
LAYFIQNLFIFEALVIYIPLFLILAFVGGYTPEFKWNFLRRKDSQLTIFIIALVVFLFSLYPAHIKPAQANLRLTNTLEAQALTVSQKLDSFEKIFEKARCPKIQEYRRQLFNMFERLVVKEDYQDTQTLSRFIEVLDKQLDKQLKDNPHKVSYYLVHMRLNNMVFNNTGSNSVERLNENFVLFEKAKKLSPTRQQVYFEVGYSFLYKGKYRESQNQPEKAQKNFEKAVEMFDYALKLNDQNFESYRQLANALVFAGKNQRVIGLLEALGEKGVDYEKKQFLTQIINTGVGAENYEIIKLMAQELIKINPENPQYYIQLALGHAHLGENEQAIETAEKISEFGSQYEQQARAFIQQVRQGAYSQ